MKVSASPTPTSTRAATASGNEVANATMTCAAVMVSAPVSTIARAPNRSSSSPTGTCSSA
nr:hypothetical protein [Pseudonocardia sp. HH130630-07]